jgi:hypothetical protein
VDDISGPLVEERREGHVSAELLSICAEHAPTLLLVGARGSQGFAGLIIGSTTRDMLDYAQGPVLVVRPPPGVEMQQASSVCLRPRIASSPGWGSVFDTDEQLRRAVDNGHRSVPLIEEDRRRCLIA